MRIRGGRAKRNTISSWYLLRRVSSLIGDNGRRLHLSSHQGKEREREFFRGLFSPYQAGQRRLLCGGPVEGIDILRSGVAEHQRDVAGIQSKPDTPPPGGLKVFQIGNLLKFVVADSYPEYGGVLGKTKGR